MNQNPSSSQAPQQNASPFPAPPEYVQNYSNENIRTYQAPKPPKIPSRFTVFNEEYNLEGVSVLLIVFYIILAYDAFFGRSRDPTILQQ